MYPLTTVKCSKCGVDMEEKGRLESESQGEGVFLQCPKCKNVEFRTKRSNQWFRSEYP